MAFDEMFLNDSFKDFGCDGVVPGAVRINDGDRTLLANAETVGLRAKHAVVRPREAQFFETALEVVPGLDTDLLRSALRLGLIRAKKDVPSDVLDLELFDEFLEVSHDPIINDQA